MTSLTNLRRFTLVLLAVANVVIVVESNYRIAAWRKLAVGQNAALEKAVKLEKEQNETIKLLIAGEHGQNEEMFVWGIRCTVEGLDDYIKEANKDGARDLQMNSAMLRTWVELSLRRRNSELTNLPPLNWKLVPDSFDLQLGTAPK